MSTLSIIIPVWNVTPEHVDMTELCIARIREVARANHEILVIDNGSPHRPVNGFNAEYSTLWNENKGIAPAWNEGVKRAKGDAYCFLNNDVWVMPEWDIALVSVATQMNSIAFPFTSEGGKNSFIMSNGGVAGWCFVIPKPVWEQIGTFDETFVPAFYEDTDYFHRAWAAEIPLVMVEAAKVYHSRRTTARHLERMNWLFQANRFRYGWKHNVDPNDAPPFYSREVPLIEVAHSNGSSDCGPTVATEDSMRV